jgi:hypothetical protein
MPIMQYFDSRPVFDSGTKLAGGSHKILDSNESTAFLRQLEHIKTQVQEIEYTDLMARKLLPVSNEAGAGAEYITWRQFDKVGLARIIRDYSDDLPRVDVLGTEFYQNPVVGIGAAYGYNVQEVRASQMVGGKPLDQRRAAAADEAIRRAEDDLAWFGDPRTKLIGFINAPNSTAVVLANDGAGNSVLFSTKTADQQLRDLNLVVNTIVESTKMVEKPDTLLLPLNVFNLISTKRIGFDSPMTVLEFFLKTQPYIKAVEPLVKLTGAGANGTNRMIAYKRDSMKLTMEVPLDITSHEPEKEGLEYEVAMESRYGGILIYKPMSIAYADGI